MKDYSLLTFEKNKLLLRNWTKTFLTDLNNKVFSLFNYNNFFIPDFIERKGEETNPPEKYQDLLYHQWYRLQEEDDKTKWLNAPTAYAIISYARNENEIDNEYGYIRNNPSYYALIPSGWGGFYDIYVDKGIWFFDYYKYAEEIFGRKNLIYNINSFASRFFINQEGSHAIISGEDGQTVYAAAKTSSAESEQEIIIDYSGARWTDITSNPVMGFNFYQNEEIILDNILYYSRFEKTNIAGYTIIRKNKDTTSEPNEDYIVAPSDSYIVLI